MLKENSGATSTLGLIKHWYLVNRSLRFVFMIIECKEFYNASIRTNVLLDQKFILRLQMRLFATCLEKLQLIYKKINPDAKLITYKAYIKSFELIDCII